MVTRKFAFLLGLSAILFVGCAPKKNAKERIRVGRTANSPVSSNPSTGQVNSYSSSNPNTQWFGINGNSGNFQQAVYQLGQSSLAGASQEDQLGTVSPTAGNNGGVFVWGAVKMNASGQIDSAASKLHIEIFDSKYGQYRADGSQITQLFLHIGSEQEGFYGVQSGTDGIYFSSDFLLVWLNGSVQGNTYAGTLYFANAATNYSYVPLGSFQVPVSGFFL